MRLPVILTELLITCITHQGSDLHLSPKLAPRMRVHGRLIPIPGSLVLDEETTEQLIYSLMDEEQQINFENQKELDFAIHVLDIANFRVNVFQQMCGVAAVFRYIPQTIPTLEDLNLPSVFKQLLELSHGLILVTGPTGSGKSTTLAAMVDYINKHQECHIITIEDPIEFIHCSNKSLITQRQVRRDTNDFASALRSALREDPDVILIGEMRDLETIRLALTAAETGHLVMATLHTSSASRTVNRIIDVFPEGEKNMIRNMLAESLQAVISQTLIQNKMQGRTAAFEMMLATPAIQHLIREDKVSQMYSVIQTGKEAGMFTLDQHLQELLRRGLIYLDDALKAAIDKSLFMSMNSW